MSSEGTGKDDASLFSLAHKGDGYDALRDLVNAVGVEMDRLVESKGINYGLIGRDSDEETKNFPEDIRYELHRLAASGSDFTFWVRKRLQKGFEDQPPMYHAHEVESGTGAWGVDAREALDRYFRDDVLDHRGDPDRLADVRERWHPGPNPVWDE